MATSFWGVSLGCVELLTGESPITFGVTASTGAGILLFASSAMICPRYGFMLESCERAS